MIYLKKMRNDAVELLPLTSDSLEMLEIRNGESGKKGGRKGKGGRTGIGDLQEKHKNTRTQVSKETKFIKNICRLLLTSSLL